MKVKASVWLALTREERLVCLEFASWENKRKMPGQAPGHR